MSTGILFGSCNRQNLPSVHWLRMLQVMYDEGVHTEAFFWSGDSVYAKNNSLEGLKAAYATLSNDINYRTFLRQLYIDGTWDDHDFGINDAGKHVPDKMGRALAYLQFLNTGRTITRKPAALVKNVEEKSGLYHTRIVKNRQGGGGVAKFLFLDTRFNRDEHFVRSLGEVKLPLTALIAAAFRTAYSLLGFGREYAGDVLGDKQWAWLEKELASRTTKGLGGKRDNATVDVDYFVIVSSIQVFTSNPVVESWGHFPVAKRRLVDLLRRYNPSGLVVLSGDVHHAETITVPVVQLENKQDAQQQQQQQQQSWIEVTSSGLTHSATDGILNRLLCPLMLWAFSGHRVLEEDGTYMKRNYGSIVFDKSSMNVSVRDINSGAVFLNRVVRPTLHGNAELAEVQIIDFPRFSSSLVITSALAAFALIVTFILAVLRSVKSSKKKTDQKRKREPTKLE